MPPVPPKPPKRGILKGPRNSAGAKDLQHRQSNSSHNSTIDNAAELIKNTLQNELITYENLTNKRGTSASAGPTDNHHLEEVDINTIFYDSKFSILLLVACEIYFLCSYACVRAVCE